MGPWYLQVLEAHPPRLPKKNVQRLHGRWLAAPVLRYSRPSTPIVLETIPEAPFAWPETPMGAGLCLGKNGWKVATACWKCWTCWNVEFLNQLYQIKTDFGGYHAISICWNPCGIKSIKSTVFVEEIFTEV